MISIQRWMTGLTLGVLLGTTALASQETKIPFAELAKEFREARSLGDADPATLDLDAVLQSGHYVGLELGTFELWYPADGLKDKKNVEEFKELVQGLARLHSRWLEYAYYGSVGYEAVQDDLAVIEKWAKSWSPNAVRKVSTEASSDLYELLEAKDNVKEAVKNVRAFVMEGIKARSWKGGWKNQEVPITRLVLTPTRRDFLEHTAFGGEISDEMRPVLWSDAMVNRTSSWIGRTQVVALVNASYPVDIEHPYGESSMDAHDKTGQLQQVIDRAAMSLLRDVYYYYGTHFFETAIATNLVIAVCGRNLIGFSGSTEWKQAGATTSSYSRFVPGGNPAGGALPQRRATGGPLQITAAYVSDWNATKGENFFLEALKKSQKRGAKNGDRDKDAPNYKDKHAHFEVRTETSAKTVVSAPFFGPDAEGKKLPPHDFLDDYEEFFRAYRSAFFEWIRVHGGDDTQDSKRKFSELIDKQATREKGVPLHKVIKEIYGVPLSGLTRDGDSLEWRFLDWLPKGKPFVSGRG